MELEYTKYKKHSLGFARYLHTAFITCSNLPNFMVHIPEVEFSMSCLWVTRPNPNKRLNSNPSETPLCLFSAQGRLLILPCELTSYITIIRPTFSSTSGRKEGHSLSASSQLSKTLLALRSRSPMLSFLGKVRWWGQLLCLPLSTDPYSREFFLNCLLPDLPLLDLR